MNLRDDEEEASVLCSVLEIFEFFDTYIVSTAGPSQEPGTLVGGIPGTL